MKIGAIVLAGGKSSRMGQDKGLMNFRGKPMVQWVLESVSRLTKDVLIVAHDGRYREFGHNVVGDEIKEIGPIGGIVTGLHQSACEVNLVLGCDLPFVTAELLEFMLENHRDVLVTCGFDGQHIHPLVGVYDRSALSGLTSCIHNGNHKLTGAVKQLPHRLLDLPNTMPGFRSEWLLNVNTPREWEEVNQTNMFT